MRYFFLLEPYRIYLFHDDRLQIDSEAEINNFMCQNFISLQSPQPKEVEIYEMHSACRMICLNSKQKASRERIKIYKIYMISTEANSQEFHDDMTCDERNVKF